MTGSLHVSLVVHVGEEVVDEGGLAALLGLQRVAPVGRHADDGPGARRGAQQKPPEHRRCRGDKQNVTRLATQTRHTRSGFDR